MRILGIDCGSECTGYGVIDSDGREHRIVTSGTIRTDAKTAFELRLAEIAGGLRRVIRECQPDAAAVEEVFHAVNPKTAIKLAHVRGIALLIIAEAGLEFGEYSPLEIKTSVVGYGRAEKHQVQRMVNELLALKEPITSEDASDAIAVAICHATHASPRSRV